MKRAVVLVLWLGVLGACVWQLMRTPIAADLSAFLPRAPSPAQQALVDQLRTGPVSRLLLVALQGVDEARLAALSRVLAQRIAADPAFIQVNNGGLDLIEADTAFLRSHRYLLSPGVTSARFTAEGLRTALQESLDLLGSPGGLLAAQWLAADPTGEMLRLLDALQGGETPARRHGVWFSSDGRRALLIVQTRAAGYDLDAQQAAIARLRAVFDEVRRERDAEKATLLVSGPAVFATATRSAVRDDARRLAAVATVLVAGLLLLAYRSLRVLLLTLVPVLSGATVAAAGIGLINGSIHGVTLGFGVTLIGEAVDYAVYLFTRSGPDTPPERALERIWPTLRLGVATSIVGFGAMLFSGFPGLAQIALFSITGLLAALLTTRFVLPVLAPRDFHAWAAASLGEAMLSLARTAMRLRLAAALLLVAGIAWLAWVRAPVWDDDLSRLSPVPETEMRLDADLRRQLGAPDVRHLVLVGADSRQHALQTAEQVGAVLDGLVEQRALSGYESPARYLPSLETQKARQEALPDAESLKRNLATAMRDLPFRRDSFGAFALDVAAARSARLVDRDALDGTALALRVDALLSARDGRWYALLPVRGVERPSALSEALAPLAGKGVVVLDLKRDSDALYRSYRARALRFSMIGAAAIATLLLVSLHGLRRTWEVLAPLIAAVVGTVVLLTAAGWQLTLFHLVALLLVVGIGSNYSLFFERDTLLQTDPRRTLASLALCSLSTILAFGLLATASTPVLSAIGITVATGAALSLLFSAIFSSALRPRRRY